MIELKLTSQVEMPLYQCHKQVRAAKVLSLINGGVDKDGFVELILEGIEGSIFVEMGWVLRHLPCVGGYYIMYEDGYVSYSPADVFERGYTEVVDKIPDE